MRNEKISLKNRLLKICEVFLILIVVATIASPKLIVAEEQIVPVNQYFVVEKKWENDLASERPSAVTINVIDSTDPDTIVATGNLTSDNGWKYAFSLPAYYEGTTDLIKYAVYEESSGLNKYELSNPENNPKIIEKSILVEDNSQRTEVAISDYKTNNLGFDAVPSGTVVLDTALDLATASITMDDGIFSYDPDFKIYGDTESYSNQYKRIIYTGDLSVGDNSLNDKTIVLSWTNKAKDFLTGEKYGVRITVSNIVIHSEADITNSTSDSKKYVALLGYNGSNLETNAYLGPTYDSWKKNFIGVKENVKLEVIDKDGNLVKGFTDIYFEDLDQPDYFDMYNNEGGVAGHRENYFGINRNWIESIKVKGGVYSEFYLNSSSNLGNVKDSVGIKFGPNVSPSSDVAYTSLKFLASTGGSFNYDWIGSNCGTAIISQSSSTPDTKDYTNSISNTSSFYMARYFFQKDDGTYSLTPDASDKLIMIKPGNKVSVKNNATTDPKEVSLPSTSTIDKENYVLDAVKTDVETEKEVTTSHTAVNPRLLDVYFKKVYTVIYHDNVEDKVWDPKDQTNTPLDHGVQTPGFDTDKETADIQAGDPVRAGYKFLGWSLNKDESDPANYLSSEDVMALTVAKENDDTPYVIDYWAHWEALPNKYVVHYFYEVNGVYPSSDHPDYVSEIRTDKKTDEVASIINSDKIPSPEKQNYYLNNGMTSEWSKTVAGDGSTILRVYFKKLAESNDKGSFKIPVTGIK